MAAAVGLIYGKDMAALTLREYHDRTKHSLASVRSGAHSLDWDNQPLPFKIYPDLEALPLPTGPPPRSREDRDRYAVTVRLRVTDDRGLTAESRRSFFVLDDPAWKPGFRSGSMTSRACASKSAC